MIRIYAIIGMSLALAASGWFILHQRSTIAEQALTIDIAEARAKSAVEAAELMGRQVTRYADQAQAARQAADVARDGIAAARQRVQAARVSGGDTAAAQEAASALSGVFGGGE